jgi:hypothetical protein
MKILLALFLLILEHESWAGMTLVDRLMTIKQVVSSSGCNTHFCVTSGTYTGNGTGKSITGLGFTPNIVIVKQDGSNRAVLRSSTMTGSKGLTETVALESGVITSLDSDGFTVGTDVRSNSNGGTYYWVSFK